MNLKKMVMLVALITACGAYAEENILKSSAVSAEHGWDHFQHQNLSDAGGKVEFSEGKIVCVIPAAADKKDNWLQLFKMVDLQSGDRYVLKFTIESEGTGKVTIGYVQCMAPYTWFASSTVKLLPGENTYTTEFSVKKEKGNNADSACKLDFLLGNLTGKVTISDVSLEKKI